MNDNDLMQWATQYAGSGLSELKARERDLVIKNSEIRAKREEREPLSKELRKAERDVEIARVTRPSGSQGWPRVACVMLCIAALALESGPNWLAAEGTLLADRIGIALIAVGLLGSAYSLSIISGILARKQAALAAPAGIMGKVLLRPAWLGGVVPLEVKLLGSTPMQRIVHSALYTVVTIGVLLRWKFAFSVDNGFGALVSWLGMSVSMFVGILFAHLGAANFPRKTAYDEAVELKQRVKKSVALADEQLTLLDAELRETERATTDARDKFYLELIALVESAVSTEAVNNIADLLLNPSDWMTRAGATASEVVSDLAARRAS